MDIENMYLILPLFMCMYHCIFMYYTRHGMSMIHYTKISSLINQPSNSYVYHLNSADNQCHHNKQIQIQTGVYKTCLRENFQQSKMKLICQIWEICPLNPLFIHEIIIWFGQISFISLLLIIVLTQPHLSSFFHLAVPCGNNWAVS